MGNYVFVEVRKFLLVFFLFFLVVILFQGNSKPMHLIGGSWSFFIIRDIIPCR